MESRTFHQRADASQHGRAAEGIGEPSSEISPAVGEIRPRSIRIVVVLPEPFGPKKP